MNIKRISIVLRKYSTDKVYLHTDLPGSTFPFYENLILQFDCAANRAKDYVAEHFPNIPVEVIQS